MSSRPFVALVILIVASSALGLTGCSSAPRTQGEAELLEQRADLTIARSKRQDPSLNRFFEDSHGWAVFPSVGKGGLGVGGAYGEGVVYEQGRRIGTAELTQVTIGLQIGGQTYSELIFFQRESDLRNFRRGNLEFDAQATAVALDRGAGANADYDKGVAIFTLGEKGLMAEASIGGQKFSFEPWPE